MFENSKWICSEKDYGNTPMVYFRDLNVIYPLKRAILHVASGGIYTVYVGKDKVEDTLFTPEQAASDKHHVYRSYDITSLVAESDFLYIFVASDRDEEKPKKILQIMDFALIAQIDLEFAGGLRQTIVTDESWTCGTVNVPQSDIGGGIFNANIKPVFEDAVKVLNGDKKQFLSEATQNQ